MATTRRPPPPSPPQLSALALESLAGPTLLIDGELRVVAASPGVASLLGAPIPEGALVTRALCGPSVDRPIAEALASGQAVDGTVTRARPDGTTVTLRVRASPLRDDGALAGWLLHLNEREETEGDGPDAPVRFQGMLTRDPAMKQVFHVLRRAARRDVPVLVRGETGSGKELVARAIHDLSPRTRGPYKAINCAALPPSLLESELFGHVKGSFTGATRDHAGIFRATDKGTLFLDEIAEMPVELQAKLLRVLETRTVIPVGGSEAVPVNVRIVAATHQSLRRAVERGTFRADLMYRLRVVPLFLPPLRARRGDVALLARHLVDELNGAGERHVTRIAPGALAALERYPWPGNVRELRNALEYAFVIGEGATLTEADLPPEITQSEASEEAEAPIAPADFPSAPGATPEVQRIQRALARAGGNRTKAAKILGVSRVTLWRRLRELGIDG